MEKSEKYLAWSLVSAIILFSVGIISGVINQVMWFDTTIDALSVYLMIIAMIPLLAFQFLYSANFDLYGTSSKKIFKVFFYLLIFPTIDVCFISGLNTLYQIVPSFEGITDPTEFELVRISAAQHLICWWATTYLVIIITGKIFFTIRSLSYWKYYFDNLDPN